MVEVPELPERPKLTIAVGDRTIKMTYGLEMDLRRLLPTPQAAVSLLTSDSYVQDYVLRRVLTPKNEIITDPDKLVKVEDVDIDSDDLNRVMAWAADHALYFFVKRAHSMAQLGVRYETVLKKPTTTGSESSGSTTPSAGPSA